MSVLAIVQARLGSKRFPEKVIKSIGDASMIELLLKRLSRSEEITSICVATSLSQRDDPLAEHLKSLGFICERGSENDVLARYAQVAKKHNPKIVVRVTGDCPLIDPILVDKAIKQLRELDVDYVSNVRDPSYPDGLDVEVMTIEALERSALEAETEYEREHVTPYIQKSDTFSKHDFKNDEDLSSLRFTVDEFADLEVIRNVFNFFAPDIFFSWKDVVRLYQNKPELFSLNTHIKRNQGSLMTSGQKLWSRAKRVIPGGNMLLSKRAEMFSPALWPTYFSKAKGCSVWDLDGREYIDMSFMGVGTNTLGYGHPEVDESVLQVLGSGNMSTLNCPEEVYLAERLVQLHPWADMARFARSGGEANAIAVRIARAYAGKDKIAVCGYHGWHDWYLAANLDDDQQLDGHLLPGLEPAGVPRDLAGSVYTFEYNCFDELEELVRNQDIGVIKMEVQRNRDPANNFLQKVRKLASERQIVLVFDECTSGFRETFGGLHKKYNVEPDLAIFGKALGNGYAITAVIGRREIMQAAQSSFISSTFWTERIGSVAALKTLEVMERERTWEFLTYTGEKIRAGWQCLGEKYDLDLLHFGIAALAGFTIQSPNALAYKTLITEKMLDQGYLAGNCVYACIEHTQSIIEDYLECLDPIFALISECEHGADVNSLLQGPICHGGFNRLN
jgi:glutamate-1-semialdehyde 2,1-aminomutase